MKKFLIGVAVILLVLYCGFWVFVNGKITKALSDSAALQESGYAIMVDPDSPKGFPLSFTRDILSLNYKTPPPEDGAAFEGPTIMVNLSKIALRVPAYWPFQYHFRHDGDARIDVKLPLQPRYNFDITPMVLRGIYKTSPGGASRQITANVTGAKIEPLPGSFPLLLDTVQSLKFDIGLQDSGTEGLINLDVNVDAQNAAFIGDALPEIFEMFGDDIEALSFNCAGKIDTRPAGIMASETAVNCSDIAVQWGVLDVIATLDLRGDLQRPTGSLILYIKNEKALLGRVSKFTSFTDLPRLSLAERALSRLPENADGRKEIPLTFRDGEPTFLGIKLGKFQ